MKRNRPASLLVIAAALISSGCGGGAERAGGDTKSTNATTAVNSASPTPTADAVPAGTAPAPTATADTAASQQGAAPASGARGAGGAAPAQMPTPRVGSGGNDLFLFTQARAAFNNDADLKAANVVIEVKEGVVTLGGTVASAALKSKAEQLARGAGAKDVRNQLKVSAGR